MTKLDFSSGKSQDLKENQSPTNDNTTAEKADDNINNEKQPKNHFQHLLTTLGLDPRHDGTGPQISFAYIGMDWAFMLQVANAQATLSVISLLCLMGSMFLMNLYNSTSFIWTIYLLTCAYFGLKAGRWQSYSHAVAYCIMCAIQSLVYMSTMCWFFHSYYVFSNTQSYEFIRSATSDAVLILALGEILCVVGTVLTGIFGLIGCCRGFGRLLHAQEKMILDYQNVLIGAYDNAHQLNPV